MALLGSTIKNPEIMKANSNTVGISRNTTLPIMLKAISAKRQKAMNTIKYPDWGLIVFSILF
ncbi:hypothetical protein GCM10027284_12050 [Cyclobacterium sediminis]